MSGWHMWKIISHSDHPFNSYERKSKCFIYVHNQMRLIGFRMKILAASDTKSDCAIRCTWVLSLHLYRWEQCMYNRSPERDQKGHVKNLEELWHGQKWLHLFVDSEADHEQMGPISSSNESLDIALSIAHTWSPRQRNFRPSTHQNWPQ